METEKSEFKRLIELMGWSQSDAARRLRNTPSAINHLINPNHRNKPTQTMMQLLKLIIASERPDLINPQTFELRNASPQALHLSQKERLLIEGLRKLPPPEQTKIYAITDAFLRASGLKIVKRRK